MLVTYKFNGPLDEIYATLVVRLHHTEAFEKKQLWRFAADFKTQTGKFLGLKLTKKAEGAGELEVYFEPGISNETQVSFIRYVHEHLMRKAQDVVRLRHFVCDRCGTAVENRQGHRSAAGKRIQGHRLLRLRRAGAALGPDRGAVRLARVHRAGAPDGRAGEGRDRQREQGADPRRPCLRHRRRGRADLPAVRQLGPWDRRRDRVQGSRGQGERKAAVPSAQVG